MAFYRAYRTDVAPHERFMQNSRNRNAVMLKSMATGNRLRQTHMAREVGTRDCFFDAPRYSLLAQCPRRGFESRRTGRSIALRSGHYSTRRFVPRGRVRSWKIAHEAADLVTREHPFYDSITDCQSGSSSRRTNGYSGSTSPRESAADYAALVEQRICFLVAQRVIEGSRDTHILIEGSSNN